ncbi:MAG: rhodanese-like domain-containing protein [Chthoniobacterales bacterium]
MKLLLRQSLVLLTLPLLPAVVEGLYYHDKISWTSPIAASDEVSLEEARAFAGNIIWVDARHDDQFEQDHAPGALPLNEDHWNDLLPRVLENWSPEKRTVVYCSSKGCGASREVARRLREEAGLKSVYVLTGGWEAWLAARK